MLAQSSSIPLAERMRPKHLNEYLGQQHLLGEDAVLKKSLTQGYMPSAIFWGPPGVGKTTLALLIATELNCKLFVLSAIHSGVKEIREVFQQAKEMKLKQASIPILFIDEIHRFSKSQQDSLLAAVEQGVVILIGATTENPSFEVISALLSRCQVYVLKSLDTTTLKTLLDAAIHTDEHLKKLNIQILSDKALLLLSGGDARKLLNALELVVNQQKNNTTIIIDDEKVIQAIQQHIVIYDKNGDQHYDIISAFIKSIRGSDPNAALYWLSRMIIAGEDPKFIARRLIISASEDIGLANPNALLLAQAGFQSVEIIGMPEARIILAQVTIYLATSPKSNASYKAIGKALDLVKQTGNLPVPLHLRNAPTQLMKKLDYGTNYKYSHDYTNNFTQQNYLPETISHTKIYQPGLNTAEDKILHQLKIWWDKFYDY